MVKAGAVFTFVAVLMLAVVPGAHAISIVTDTTWTCTSVLGTACGGATAVSAAPAPIPPWAPETTGDWITSTNSAVALGTQTTFSKVIDFGTTGSILTLKVWADDTAAVALTGGALTFNNPGLAPNPALDSACAAGVLGCEANEFGSFSTGLLTGLHTLTVTVDQLVASTPFGTLVEGDLLAPVPEPATILLLGSALAAAGVASRRFRKAEAPKA